MIKTIKVTKEIWSELMKIRIDWDAKNINEVIQRLLIILKKIKKGGKKK